MARNSLRKPPLQQASEEVVLAQDTPVSTQGPPSVAVAVAAAAVAAAAVAAAAVAAVVVAAAAVAAAAVAAVVVAAAAVATAAVAAAAVAAAAAATAITLRLLLSRKKEHHISVVILEHPRHPALQPALPGRNVWRKSEPVHMVGLLARWTNSKLTPKGVELPVTNRKARVRGIVARTLTKCLQVGPAQGEQVQYPQLRVVTLTNQVELVVVVVDAGERTVTQSQVWRGHSRVFTPSQGQKRQRVDGCLCQRDHPQ